MKIKHLILIVSAIVLLGFTGCKDMQNPVDTDTTDNSVILSEAVVINGDLATSQVVGCSLETDAFIPGVETIYENCILDEKDLGTTPKNSKVPLTKVLRLLKLTEKQIAMLKEYNLAHRDCIESVMLKWQKAVAPIIEKANAQKRLVMTALKNKEITRKEAAQKLAAIDKALRAELAALELRANIKLAIEDCNKKLLAQIKAMLDKDQLAIWLKYFPESNVTGSKK